MRDRLVTLAGALLALVVIYGLFFAEQEVPEPARPVTTEVASNGLVALKTWLDGEGVATLSLRERYPELAAHPELPAATGNVLLVALPYYRPPREAEVAELKSWVQAGNTLLIMAALNDTSDWSTAVPSRLIDDLGSVADTYFRAINEDGDDYRSPLLSLFDDDPDAERYAVEPREGHPLVEGIERMAAESDMVTSIWVPDAYNNGDLILELATIPLTGTPLIWQRKTGDGQTIIVGSGTMFTNRAIARADNRRFIANVVAHHLGPDGRFVFDDMHQGLSALYDPDAFYSDSRLHTTIWFVIGFWLLYVVGSSNRLLNPRAETLALRQTDFVQAVGGFISNNSSKTDAGLWLFRSWFNDVRRHLHLPTNGEPVWSELDGLRTLDPKLLGRLKRQHARLSTGRALDLVDIHNTINRARQAIG